MRFRRRWISVAVVLAGLLAVSSGSLASAASVKSSSSSGSSSSTTVKPDFAWFHGKTINYIVASTPGSASGVAIVSMQPALEKILGASVDISYNTLASNIPEDIVGTSNPNGLTLGSMVLDTVLTDIYANSATLSFPLVKTSFVGSTYAQTYVFVGCDESTFSSFTQIVNQKIPLTIPIITLGAINMLSHFLTAAYSLPSKYLTGYTSGNVIQGCQRGDGNFTVNSLAHVLNTSQTASVPGLPPLLLTGKIPSDFPAAFLDKQAPTVASFVKQYPPKTTFGKNAIKYLLEEFDASSPGYATFGPPGIPKARLLALQDAFSMASKQAAVKQGFISGGLPPGLVAPGAILPYLKSQIKHQSLIERYWNNGS